MKLIKMICLLSVVSLSLSANDTLRQYPKFIFELSGCPFKLFNSIDTYNQDESNVTVSSYKLKMNSLISFSSNYRLLKSNKTPHQLFVGLGLSYCNSQVNHTFYDHQLYGWHASGVKINYSQNEFNFNVNALSLSPNIGYYILLKQIVLINKIGFNYSFLKSTKSYTYDELQYSWGYQTDPTYVTPTNPDGWYYSNTLYKSESKKDNINEKTAHLFYSTGIGFKINKLMPFVNFEVTKFSNKFDHLFFKYQLGLSYLF